MTKGKSKRSATRPTANARGARPKKPYPSVLFEKALQVPTQIKEKNAGHPWTRDDVAAEIGMSPKSSDFFYVTAASRDFDLTAGTRDSAQISLADLGREIVYAPDPEVERSKRLKHSSESTFLQRCCITTRAAIYPTSNICLTLCNGSLG